MAGYFGGWADNALMRIVDIVLSIPTFFLILMLVAFWGTGNAWVDHHRHRVDRLDDGRAAGARRVPVAARGRLRAGGARPSAPATGGS